MEYNCKCGIEGKEFDSVIQSETNFNVTAVQLAHSIMGWFSGLDDLRENDWPIFKDDGVYLIWEKMIIVQGTSFFILRHYM